MDSTSGSKTYNIENIEVIHLKPHKHRTNVIQISRRTHYVPQDTHGFVLNSNASTINKQISQHLVDLQEEVPLSYNLTPIPLLKVSGTPMIRIYSRR